MCQIVSGALILFAARVSTHDISGTSEVYHMKKIFSFFVTMTMLWCARGDSSICIDMRSYNYRDGDSHYSVTITWTYLISDGKAQVGDGTKCAIQLCDHPLDLEIISLANRYPVLGIASNAFAYCSTVGSMVIPYSVKTIGASAFAWCIEMKSVTIPMTVKDIAEDAFCGCIALTNVTIPASITNIGDYAFSDCINMENMVFDGDMPNFGEGVFDGMPEDMILTIGKNAKGWDYYEKQGLTPPWGSRIVIRKGDVIDDGHGISEVVSSTGVTLTITNVVVHYVVNSMQPAKMIPASYDTGFINIITEVKSGGAVSVPATWTMNYPNYVTKFGGNFTKSLMKPTGKRDGSGNAMLVWQDYVAGTDPTDENDVFTASITTDSTGKLIISYTPELNDDEKAKRIYKTLGKIKLTDSDWTEVPAGHEADYNFFKVTVEMK